MIGAIKEWIIGVAITIIFISIVDLVMPDSGFKKYAKLATGLIVIITVISPLFKLLKGGIGVEKYIEDYTAALSLDKGTDTSQVDAMVNDEIIRLFKENLKEEIEEDISTCLNKTCKVTALEVNEDTSSNSFGKILYIEIKALNGGVESIKPVEKIVIGREQPVINEKEERDEEILQLLSDRYEVEPSAVKFIK